MRDVTTLAKQAIQQQQLHAGQAQQAPAAPAVERKLFIVLHGMYGNLFLSKFATGEKDDQGRDKGVRTAMKVWGSALAKFPVSVIEAATERLMTEHPDFPPALPQFVRLCEAVMPRKTHAELQGWAALPAPEQPALVAVDFERKGDGKDNWRCIWARHQAGHRVPMFALRAAMGVLGIKKDSER